MLLVLCEQQQQKQVAIDWSSDLAEDTNVYFVKYWNLTWVCAANIKVLSLAPVKSHHSFRCVRLSTNGLADSWSHNRMFNKKDSGTHIIEVFWLDTINLEKTEPLERSEDSIGYSVSVNCLRNVK